MCSMYMLLTYSGPINKFYSESDDQKRSLIGCLRPIGGEVANVVALVMLTFTTEIENDYSSANDIYASLVDQRTSRHHIYNVQREHVIMFLSVSWIRTFLRKKWNCSFQRTVKKSDKLEEYCSNPYSFKFEVAACDRPS